MKKCLLCPNQCNVDRDKTTGVCQVNKSFKIAKYGLHPYEEPPISYKNGSGTIFFMVALWGVLFAKTIPFHTLYRQVSWQNRTISLL